MWIFISVELVSIVAFAAARNWSAVAMGLVAIAMVIAMDRTRTDRAEPNLVACIIFGRVPLAVARSLREEPETWSRDNDHDPYLTHTYELTHVSGVKVWVNQGASGVFVSAVGCGCWGGDGVLSTLGLSPGRWLIWSAAKPLCDLTCKSTRCLTERLYGADA